MWDRARECAQHIGSWIWGYFCLFDLLGVIPICCWEWPYPLRRLESWLCRGWPACGVWTCPVVGCWPYLRYQNIYSNITSCVDAYMSRGPLFLSLHASRGCWFLRWMQCRACQGAWDARWRGRSFSSLLDRHMVCELLCLGVEGCNGMGRQQVL